MLELAKKRGLDVHEGSVTDLPFPDATFDVTCSFKVLAHVPDIGRALAEMARVTKPGGVILAELYNPWSFRGLAKRLGPAGRISDKTRESAVYTRFDSPLTVAKIIPPGTRVETARGIRIVTPAAVAIDIPVVGGMFRAAERWLCDTPAANFAGFYCAVIRKG
jgi:SAM-dependent methyltransferase